MPRRKYDDFVNRLLGSSIFGFHLVASVCGENYAKQLVYRLKKKDLIVELVKGVYTPKKSPYMIVKAIPLSYVGLGSAAFLHGALSQVTVLTVLTPWASKLVRPGVRVLAGQKVIIRKISQKMYFGYDYIYVEEINEHVRVSDPEKTLIDAVYFDYPLLPDMLPGLLEMADRNKLYSYLDEMKRKKVKGWRKTRKRIDEMLKTFKY
ncbi:MAG: type IV toxin-antitoxin system AbiEi family antitoxin [Thermofilum sp.]|nr:type IV toxin-antitoxin system AbiEi family antitoxin [Thermofilum sp.]